MADAASRSGKSGDDAPDLPQEDVVDEHAARMRELADNIPTLCWIAKPDGHIYWYNARWYEYTGTTPDDQLGWGWQSVHHPDVLPDVMEKWKSSIASGEPFEMVFPLKGADGVFRPFLTRVAPSRNADGKIVAWFGMNTDVTEQRRHEEDLKLLVAELNHRVRNNLSVIHAVAVQTFRRARSVEEGLEIFEARLMAIAAAHNVLTTDNWLGADIRPVIENAVMPFGRGRFEIEGPALWLPPKKVLALSMALHELLTNAAKYGALSVADGNVRITWHVDQTADRLKLAWTERGGPPVTPPTRQGFGSQLIERVLAADLEGSTALEFDPAGVVCRIEMAAGR